MFLALDCLLRNSQRPLGSQIFCQIIPFGISHDCLIMFLMKMMNLMFRTTNLTERLVTNSANGSNSLLRNLRSPLGIPILLQFQIFWVQMTSYIKLQLTLTLILILTIFAQINAL